MRFLSRDLVIVRWVTFIALSILGSLLLIYAFPWNPSGLLTGLATLALAAGIAGLVTWVAESWLRLLLRSVSVDEKVLLSERRLEDARRQIRVGFGLIRSLFSVQSEMEIIETVMRVACDVVNANGCSFIPFNEWGQVYPPLTYGRVPHGTLQAWSDRLLEPRTRQVCKACSSRHGAKDCILLKGTDSEKRLVYCRSLTHGNREIGLINFFFDSPFSTLDQDQETYLDEMLGLADFALESFRIKDREMAALHYLQVGNAAEGDLSKLLSNLLENIHQAFDIENAFIWIPAQNDRVLSEIRLSCAHDDNQDRFPGSEFLSGFWQSVVSPENPATYKELTIRDKSGKHRNYLVLPMLLPDDQAVGLLVLDFEKQESFSSRQANILLTIAGQAALLVRNSQLVMQVEYQAIVDERMRLSREIHDGLAQTLAFLKMQSSQMQGYLSAGDLDRLKDLIEASNRTLADAYLDARQAIDNLRRIPDKTLLESLRMTGEDFQSMSGLELSFSHDDVLAAVPPTEIAQIIRIVQEALNNVRKHASAKRVDLSIINVDDRIQIEIQDDGQGFDPDKIRPYRQHGIAGMRERAELIDAELLVDTRSGSGTNVKLILPAKRYEVA